MSSSKSDYRKAISVKTEPVDDVSMAKPSESSSQASKSPDLDHVPSTSTVPKCSRLSVQRSVIVSAPSSASSTKSVLAHSSAVLPGGSQSVIQSPLNEAQRLLVNARNAFAVASSLIPPQVVLPPLPPLRRIPGAGTSQSIVFPTPEPAPLIPAAAAATVLATEVLRPRYRSPIIRTNGAATDAVIVPEIPESNLVIDEDQDQEAPKRKRGRKRAKPSAIRPAAEEEEALRDQLSGDDSIIDSEVVVPSDSDLLFLQQPVQGPVIIPLIHQPILGMQSPSQLGQVSPVLVSSHAGASTSSMVGKTPEEIEEHRLRRMRNNEAVRKSRMKARLRVKQSELNCKVLMKQFGELKTRIQTLEKELAWEKRKNEILEEMLRRTQMNTPGTSAVVPEPKPEEAQAPETNGSS